MKKLEVGMIFKNIVELCDYLELKYNKAHIDRAYKKANKFCKYHKLNKSDIIIDDVFENVKYKERSGDYFYIVGDIISTNNSKIEIIDQFRSSKNNSKHYKCKCITCKHEYPEYEYNLKKGVGCAVCSNKIVKIGVNDMWTTAPEMAELLENPDDGYKYTMKSHQKVDWKCPMCGEIIYDKAISDIYTQGASCPTCGIFRSYPNRLMYNLLKYLNVNFINEKVFDWSDNKIYDFYLIDYNVIIEMHGRQHYENYIFNEDCKNIQENDLYKETLAINNNITNYIIIDSRRSQLNFISNNIINSNLNNIIDFTNLDWNKIELLTITNVVKTACKLWDNEYTIEYIANEIGYSVDSVTRMLRKCEKNGMTKEKNKFQKIRVNKMVNTCYQRSATPLACIETNQYFGSANILSKLSVEMYGNFFHTSNIISHLQGKSKHVHNFHFKYITRDEFNTIKTHSTELTFGEFFVTQN